MTGMFILMCYSGKINKWQYQVANFTRIIPQFACSFHRFVRKCLRFNNVYETVFCLGLCLALD